MKKINWKARMRKKSFWVAIVSAVALFINNITGAFGLDFSANIEQYVSVITTILTLLAGLGVIVDPTTKGIRDSGHALDYTSPRDDSDPSQATGYIQTVDGTRESEEDGSDAVFHNNSNTGGIQ